MAWPPPTLPINRTDATPQGPGTHAGDHNAVNLAMNDTVQKVGAIDARVLVLNNVSWVNRRTGQVVVASDQWGNAANVDIPDSIAGGYLISGFAQVETGAAAISGVDMRLLATAGGTPVEVGPVLSTPGAVGANTKVNMVPMTDLYSLASTVGLSVGIQIRPRGGAINLNPGSHITIVRLYPI